MVMAIMEFQSLMLRIDSTDLFSPLEFSRTRGHQGGATKQQRMSSFSLPSPSEELKLQDLLVDLTDIQSVTLKLQEDSITLAELRRLFDALIWGFIPCASI